MTDCHAQLKPIYFREPSVNLGLGSMQGQLPHLVGEHLLKKAGVPAGTPMAHALTFLDFERAAQRYGQVGGFAHLSHAGQAAEGQPPGRAAARRRRHLAGLGHRAVDERAGHGRRLQAAGRGRDDRPLGVHLRHGAGEGDRREGLQGPGRLRRAERQDHRLRRPGVQALRDARDERRAGGHRRPGLPVHADRQPALHGRRLGVRHPGREHAEGGRRGARQGRAGGRACCRTTAWTST